MSWNEIASAVCICFSALIFSLSLQGQTKLKILFIQMFATILYLLNYLFVITLLPSAKIGAITAGFEILRLIIFFFLEKNEKYNTRKWNLFASITFSIILTVCSIFAWNGWYSILPLLATILVSLALGNKNIILIKLAFIIQASLITAYLLLLHLWINATSQVFVFVFGIIGLIIYVLKSRKQANADITQNDNTSINSNQQ